jgi:acetate kinase
MSERELADALEHRSGLLGIAGTADMPEILARAEDGNAAAQLGLEVYLHHLRAGVAAMAAALGGIDALVFTGGVGQRSPRVRELAVDGLAFLGLTIDVQHNRATRGDADVSRPGADAKTLVIVAREDLEIAGQARAALAADNGSPADLRDAD